MSNSEHRENLERQIREHQPRIRSFIKTRVTSQEDADDIAQDVFFQFVKTMETTHNPIENISGWLFRVAKNLIINKGKKRKESSLPMEVDYDEDGDIISSLFPQTEESDSPVNVYIRSLMWQELEQALAELPVEQREIFELTEMEGFPVKDIAETTGVPVNTLLSRKHYAVKYLRKRLKSTYEELINQ
ncbi:RNA polymerase sigma factor [Roseivirga pacifica]|uniref:RNA polymerase sigma factor n=1 Tax=Roseivirga pacifica TaxID=1267423 RepID=UPI002094A035|nr:RNA polymerase sigma factor [Roseivirga pacifica]MCO6359093.1 sigma-70 family RNA polymerase sigma factor [Roseivirga pacifica]MCO6365271.1 sigma-70 family RNA polymerase sigma factor [Roseivirga pacifica]MCO6371999.1 sigma-70 family RNA polymerase sigma factor [Roseivirga pacifica]MCO6375890.1 sigma-70 family RNA polymerase sigma factor [Roseivirga pacifica]MCO6379377.1 sigma-70 family RNA polymerase sigma factor [Roseivirga pacifica]